MLIDAIKACREKAEQTKETAYALQAGKAETLAGELAFGLLVLEESMREAQYLSLDDLRAMVGIPEPKQARPEDPDEYPDGVSNDDPELETPEVRKRREEFKDRGFYT